MELNRGFWHDLPVLITGHTGFKGGWLSLWLQSMGARLSGLSLPAPTEPNLFECAHVGDGMDSRIGDIRNREFVASSINDVMPEVVFHLAAQPLVRAGYADPVGTYDTNVMGTVYLLEALKQAGANSVVIVVTSDKCYENHESMRPYRETEALGGSDPYSSSKACAELVASAYEKSFPGQLHVASARAGNVIGGGDWASDRLLPDLIRCYSQEKTADIRAPQAVRPWQHVLEPLLGYLLLAQAVYDKPQEFAGAWNFGPNLDDVYTVAELADQAAALWGNGAQWQIDKGAHPHEAGLLRLDSGKAQTRLDWHPRWTTDIALQESVAWYRHQLAGDDMRLFSIAQLEKYCRIQAKQYG